jgi:DNA repair exonuclease SbcCD ATPase subunit
MATSQNFRSAFNGFNREDVVHYLEYLNSKHTALVNQLSEEADGLRQKLTVAAEAIAADSSRSERITALEAERDELLAQLEQANAARQALEAECLSLHAQLAAAATAAPAANTGRDQLEAQYMSLQAHLQETQAENLRLTEELKLAKAAPVAPVQANPTELELEAYRRAERTERMARERAEVLYRQTNGVLAEASVKVDQVAADIGTIADQVLQQLQHLQTAVTGSKQALQDASNLMYAIRPEGEEV